jgi:hypothetical protein
MAAERSRCGDAAALHADPAPRYGVANANAVANADGYAHSHAKRDGNGNHNCTYPHANAQSGADSDAITNVYAVADADGHDVVACDGNTGSIGYRDGVGAYAHADNSADGYADPSTQVSDAVRSC